MLQRKLDHHSSTPLFEQTAAEIRRAIAEGEARPGRTRRPRTWRPCSASTRTPSSRAPPPPLREEGLLEFRRGRGITVSATPEQGAVVEGARNLVQLARRHGYRLDELIEVIEAVG